MRMAKPANMQNDYKAIIEEAEPKKKATAFVNEVIVIEGPACDMASLILFTAESLMLV
jgi:hypothetical protein